MKKIIIVLGTRPEAIKLAPVIHRLQKDRVKAECILCLTSQHKEMLEGFLRLFDLKPQYDPRLMRRNQSLFDITAQGLKKIEDIYHSEKPDLVLVQGGTTTAFLASLAGFYVRTRVGHVEAGLRTHHKYNPFPEEVNRRLIGHLSDLLFAPTQEARKNLIQEGLDSQNIHVTGNTVVDALQSVSRKLSRSEVSRRIEEFFARDQGISFRNRTTLLVTSHRRESCGRDLRSICLALKDIARSSDDIQVIFPVHLNPNVQAQVKKVLSGIRNIHLLGPLKYLPFVWLMKKANLILTDSVGVQEEAPSLRTPVFVLRSGTERPEGVKAGVARLVGTERKNIVKAVEHFLSRPDVRRRMVSAVNPYGDGRASERIANVIRQSL